MDRLQLKNVKRELKNPEVWKARAIQASYIFSGLPGIHVVLDLGCGKKIIEELLPKGYNYLPVDKFDYVGDNKTIIVDVNQEGFVEKLPKGADIICILGLLEQVETEKILLELFKYPFNYLICSYWKPARMEKAKRLRYLKLSRLPQNEFLNLFKKDFTINIVWEDAAQQLYFITRKGKKHV